MLLGTFSREVKFPELEYRRVSTNIKGSSAPRALTTVLLALYFAIHH